MMKAQAIGFAILLLCSYGGASATEDVSAKVLAEVEFNDPNWGFPAYFTTAAKLNAAEMKKHLVRQCGELKLDNDVWFCGAGNLFFYTGIDGWGKRSKSGYVCEHQLGLPGQRFFGDSRFKDYECMFLWWDQEKAHYEIELPNSEQQ
jgi:hypothetical protein